MEKRNIEVINKSRELVNKFITSALVEENKIIILKVGHRKDIYK